MNSVAGRRFARYVAIGDSSTEGLDDPDCQGHYRGWADRLAHQVASAQGNLLYANLGIRGRRTRQVLDEQLGPALAMRPDLVTLFSGTNDVVGRNFDPAALATDFAAMHQAVVGSGATLLTFTLPDLSPIMPLARLVRGRIEALNDVVRSVAHESGAVLLDVARLPAAADPRVWSADRLHANSEGHRRMAAALAHAIGIPGAGGGWEDPFASQPELGAMARIRAESRWIWRYFLPWIARRLLARSSGDAISPKRPELAWVLEP